MNRFLPCSGLMALLFILNGCGPAPDAARPLALDSAAGASLPRLTAGGDDQLWLSWVEPAEGDAHRLRFSRFQKDRWGPARTVAEGRDWFVNWADFPSVVPLGRDLAAAHWLVKRPGGTYAYDVAISISTDGGESWGEPLRPHEDRSATEHGFATLFPVGHEAGDEVGGKVGAVWLDGRNMPPANTGGHAGHADHGGGMSLRFGLLSPGSGAIADKEADREADREIDPLTCDCCQTGAAVSGDGVVVVYRDRTAEEIRDISYTRFEDGRWSAPRTLAADGWRIEGCPVNGPAIDAISSAVVVAWFTGAGEPRVQVGWSADGGRNFSAPVTIDRVGVLGRVDVAMVDDDTAVVSWMAGGGDEGRAEIRYRRVDADGTLGPVRRLDTTSAARGAGFPQLAAGGGGLVFAWTRTGGDGGIATMTVPSVP